MISDADIRAFLAARRQVLAWVAASGEHLIAHDPFAEIAHEEWIEIDGNAWSYQAHRHGHTFTCRTSGGVIEVVAGEGKDEADAFNAHQLHAWLSTQDGHERLTDLAVENWLLRQLMGGRLQRHDHRPGYFRAA